MINKLYIHITYIHTFIMHYSVSLILRINSVTQKLVLPLHWWLPKSMLFEVAAGTLPLAYSTLQDPIPTTKDEKSSFVTYILYHSWSGSLPDTFHFLFRTLKLL